MYTKQGPQIRQRDARPGGTHKSGRLRHVQGTHAGPGPGQDLLWHSGLHGTRDHSQTGM